MTRAHSSCIPGSGAIPAPFLTAFGKGEDFKASIPRYRRSAQGVGKGLAWRLCGMGVVLGRLGANVLGRRRDVDVLIYKVDRLGDWLLAEPAIDRIVADGKSRGCKVALWVADESALYRKWRTPACAVESFPLEPVGAWAKIRRAWKVMGLLSTYRARSFVCLRHAPEPIRDFVLGSVDARDLRALSWVIRGESAGEVPRELLRHQSILASAGLAPSDARDLFPTLGGRAPSHDGVVVIAPFSSGSIKDWSDEAWVTVASGMASRGFAIELWVGPGQVQRAESLVKKIHSVVPSADAAPRTGSLAELAQAIGSAALVLSVDTFAAHVAVAMDVPLVSLIGGGQFGEFGPWRRSARQRWVSNRISCFGCDWSCTRAQVDCMMGIFPEAMLAEADEALQCDVERRPSEAAAS